MFYLLPHKSEASILEVSEMTCFLHNINVRLYSLKPESAFKNHQKTELGNSSRLSAKLKLFFSDSISTTA